MSQGSAIFSLAIRVVRATATHCHHTTRLQFLMTRGLRASSRNITVQRRVLSLWVLLSHFRVLSTKGLPQSHTSGHRFGAPTLPGSLSQFVQFSSQGGSVSLREIASSLPFTLIGGLLSLPRVNGYSHLQRQRYRLCSSATTSGLLLSSAHSH